MKDVMTALAERKGLILGLLAAVVLFSTGKAVLSDDKHAVAYFDSFTSIYEGDKVRVLGIEVGRIDKVTPEDDRVRVEISYDGKYDLPADVKAAVVSPTLVATRFIQLEPAYDGGPALADGGEIPLDRTASPLEFDDLKSELTRLSTTLGPNGLDKDGALSEFLNVAAENGQGQGAKFNTMVTELAKALQTLSEGRGDIFGTVRNLQVFVSAIASVDSRVTEFNQRLSGVSDLLDDNGQELTAAIASVDKTARLVRSFVKENRPHLTRSVAKLGDLTTTLANSRNDLATLLHATPNTLTNFLGIVSDRMMSVTGALALDNFNTPGGLLCTLIGQATGTTGSVLDTCGQVLAPLMDQFQVPVPPFGGTPHQTPDTSADPDGSGQLDLGGLLSSLTGEGNEGGLLGLLLPGGTS